MRFQNLALVISILALRALALPESPLRDLFTSPDVPVLHNIDLSIFNVTRNPPREAKRAMDLPYVMYSITMDGRNLGNYEEFQVSGQMLITQGIPASPTPNGDNPYDILIKIGSPAATPVAGSIWYVTNRYLYKLIDGTDADSLVDFAYVTTTGSTIDVTVDTSVAASNQLSNFNVRSGITADIYIVASGGFSVTLGTTSLSGSINVVGDTYIFYGLAPYKAVISGTMTGRGTTTI
jgi:hypothetical protein